MSGTKAYSSILSADGSLFFEQIKRQLAQGDTQGALGVAAVADQISGGTGYTAAVANYVATGQLASYPLTASIPDSTLPLPGYAQDVMRRAYGDLAKTQDIYDAFNLDYNAQDPQAVTSLLRRLEAVDPDEYRQLQTQISASLGLTLAPNAGSADLLYAYRTQPGLQNLGLSPNALTAANLVNGFGAQGYRGALANAIAGVYAPGPVNPYVFSPQLSRLYQQPYTTGLPGIEFLPGYRSFVTPIRGPGDYQATLGMDNMDISQVMNDSSLTVEDMVTLMIMLIMQKMDQDIKREAERINKLQQQQSDYKNKNDNKEMPNSPSIDIETLKLKRLVDKRSQMFDLLRQIIDKYNQTAKGIIDTMGR
jgi:hypothetical protein